MSPCAMISTSDEAILALESRFWRSQGAKEGAVRAELGLSPTRYYQRLVELTSDPAALACSPFTVRRLQRLLVVRRRPRTRL